MKMILFPSVVVVLLVISFFSDRRKSMKALSTAVKRFTAVLPVFIIRCFLAAGHIDIVVFGELSAEEWIYA